jgi:hypothetical protein
MALTKNISVSSEENLNKDFFGKFNNANLLLAATIGYTKDPAVDDTYLNLKSKTFFQDVYKRTKNHTLKYKIFKLNETTCCVVIPKFITNKIKFNMIGKPEILSFPPYCAPVPFSDTFENYNANIICNANQVYSKTENAFKIFGKVYQNNTPQFTSSSVKTTNLPAMSLFTDGAGDTSWTFWTPNATEDGPFSGNGLGGLTPVLFKGLSGVQKYGGLDDMDPEVTQSDAYNRLLKYDVSNSNPNLSRQAAGKHIFACKGFDSTTDTIEHDICMIIINESNILPGIAIDDLRDDLYNLGFEFAFGMDGSSSVFLYERKAKPEYHIGKTIKDYTTISGISIPSSAGASKNVGNILRTAYGIK